MTNSTKITKLLILVKSIDGGTGTYIKSLQKLKKYFHRNTIKIKTLILEEPEYRHLKILNSSTFQKNSSYPDNYRFNIGNIAIFIKELFWISKHLKSYKPDVVISVDHRCNIHTILYKTFSNHSLKVINTNHIALDKTIEEKATPFTYFVLKQTIKLLYKYSDRIICVSNGLSYSLNDKFNLNKKIYTVYNGFTSTHKSKPRKHPKKKGFTVLTVARLTEQKDHETLIRAVKIVSERFPYIELQIASKGPREKKLIEMVKKLKLSKNVSFLGWVKNIDEKYKKSHLFVLSSFREGFGYVIVEAMSKGLPVICSDTPFGPKEIIGNNKYGLLFKMGNANDLASKIIKVASTEQLYEELSRKSIERSTDFSERKMLTNYKEIITSLIS